MSGAGRIKGDAITSDNQYVEIKDANKSFTLTAKMLHDSWVQAMKQGRTGVKWIIQFKDKPYRLTCRLERLPNGVKADD